METLCTVIAHSNDPAKNHDMVQFAIPLRSAVELADSWKRGFKFDHVRVYAETNNGATLTLIYQPT